jgi:xylan 1,4-beta-xylosidase
MKYKLFIFTIFLLVCKFNSYAQKGYTNPVIRGFNPDPSICRVGEDYYMVTSTSYIYPGIPIYKSKDLINWKLIGHCLTKASQYFLDENHNRPEIYAPTLRYHNGIFYMITTDVNGGGNFFITSTDPAKEWSDPVKVDQPVFDPSLFFDDDGKVYYTRRGDFKNKDIVQAEIDIKTGKLLTPLKSISKGLIGDDTEGPHLFKNEYWYYLTMGEGGSRYLHMQSIARSKSPWGPWEKCPNNPIISQHNGWWHHTAAMGHADFIDDSQGNSWAVCLGQRKGGYNDFCVIGRETFLLPVQWKNGWPQVKPEYLIKLNIQAPTLPLKPWEKEPSRDDFDKPQLGLKWNLMAYPLTKTYSLTERPGYLRLKGTVESLLQSKQVAFIGLRQEEMSGEFVAKMEFSPKKENEEAGLAVYQNPNCKYELLITKRAGKTVVFLRKTVLDMYSESTKVKINASSFWLKTKFDTKTYQFSISENGNDWKTIGSGIVNLVSTDVAGTFGGVLVGLYATGNGKESTINADVDWVDLNFKEVKFDN